MSSHRSWRAWLAALLLPGSLAACGFEPIAAVPAAVGEEDLALAALDVKANDSRFAYRVRKEMLRSIVIDPSAKQSLKIDTKISRAGLAIEQNDTITRRNVTAETTYALSTKPPKGSDDIDPKVMSGRTSAVTAVNTTASQFSASISDREAVERLSLETARRLLTFLRVNRAPEDVDAR